MRLILVTCLLLLAVPAVAGAQTGAPVAMTGEATDVARTAATLHGTVDPNLTLTTYRFEYGTTKQYGSATAPKDAGDGDDPVPVEDALTGLAPVTT